MSKHTPGPWAVDPTGDIGLWQVGTLDMHIADCDGSSDAEMEANARLIAAAPDLLTACEDALDTFDALTKTWDISLFPDLKPEKRLLRAALKKAGVS